MMNTNKKTQSKNSGDRISDGKKLARLIWEEGWAPVKTVVDYPREAFIVVDEYMNVITANEAFYGTFKVDEKNTEKKPLFKLGNGQWNIPTLKKLLEDVFTKDAHFKGYEVTHDFPKIGKRTMILNARRVYRKDDATGAFWPMALIAIEDVTDLMDIALKLATQTNNSKIKEDPKKRAVAPLVENLDEILTTINLS